MDVSSGFAVDHLAALAAGIEPDHSSNVVRRLRIVVQSADAHHSTISLMSAFAVAIGVNMGWCSTYVC